MHVRLPKKSELGGEACSRSGARHTLRMQVTGLDYVCRKYQSLSLQISYLV